MSTTIHLPYGHSVVEVVLPDRKKPYHILTGRSQTALRNPSRNIAEALKNPIGCPGLIKRLGKDDKVVVITTDNTRHCPDELIVPVILNELEDFIPKKNITIIIALGLHPPLSREDLIKKLGEQVVENYEVVNHDAEKTVHLGITTRDSCRSQPQDS